MADPIIVIGAGQAGASLVAKLRALGYGGSLLLLGDEPVLPYQRPPLSKKYMSGEFTVDRLLIRAPSWYEEQKVETRLSAPVSAILPRDRLVALSDGSMLRYSKLALTTGSRPRTLPDAVGGNLAGVFTVRGLADADSIMPIFLPGRKLLVIGGGYIGLEAAAVASTKGLDVTLIEMADRILQRVAAPMTSDYFRALHTRHGVTIREATGLDALVGKEGRLVGARLKDGTRLDADLAIVGIGIHPNDGLAADAGLIVENGIHVDGQCRTSDPDIFAAGDCASFSWRGVRTRLESVQNAVEQAEHAAAAMLGAAGDYDPVPWFWSDQYDVKLQIAGLNRGYTDTVLRPGKRELSQSVWYYRGEELIAVDAMNDALAYGIGKKVLEARRSIPKAAVGDPSVELKTWLTAS
ncbi:pyridine nucleotide-disulfide oxidoreductase [Hypericibacter terrae]|uniref:Pyridine nucleotide-disulfide oxidoreductase n=1 Tax=Hypericibacter terrae TaxID=2602015 RepID=A0A5J6MG41_9PROT|nr:FAD-dependent oxidoreductase [Hypericibacter terrae]QEX16464.1 pyridine nucleotide-disulfide oxidoreductase [Hypericibacter terrae]